MEEEYNRTYPYVVKIPKSLREMQAGDFTPAREIVIEKPIEGPYSHIWFGDASEEIKLRFGYRNGDSRYVCDYALGDADVHGILAGKTGQGKSVSLNAMIYGICMEYAPWEVNLTLSDAKIVEFKSIALNTPMPNIDVIAATGDVDYLLSVLEMRKNEMMLTNSMFTKASTVYGKEIKNIKTFRKVTGLMLPQHVMIFDEFQTMFKAAQKLAPKVAALIDDFARLGRSAGFHLFLASQELGTDIPKATLDNVKLRTAMGCGEAVSTMVLGNSAAAGNVGKKGHMLINNNSDAHSEADNVLIRVPWMPPEQSKEIGNTLIKTGKEFDVTPVLRFYDEQSFLYEKDWLKFLNTFPVNNTIYLGEPSFVTEDPDQCVKLVLTCKDIENIFVLTNNNLHQQRFFKMLMHNVLRMKNATSIVMCANSMFDIECNARQLSSNLFFDENSLQKSIAISVLENTIYKRKLCLEADKYVFTEPKRTEDSDAYFYELFEKNSQYDTPTNCSRCFYYLGLLASNQEMSKHLGCDQNSATEKKIVKSCIEMCAKFNSSSSALTLDKMPAVFGWILGADRVLGMVRDNNSREMNRLKTMLLDCADVNVRFIIISSTFEDLTNLRSAFRWYLLDDLTQNEINKISAADFYPEQKSAGLAVLWDKLDTAKGCVKFKKMFMDGEVPAV